MNTRSVLQFDSKNTAWSLALDAGGSATRWALVDAMGRPVACGEVGALSGIMLASVEGQATFAQRLASLRTSVAQVTPEHAPLQAWFGLTGAGAGFDLPLATQIAAQSLGMPPERLRIASDMAMLHQLHFGPGAGHMLYAGTGSYASFWASDGRLHRVGGRGVLLDDAGGGCWLGLAALRHAWRQVESAQPRSPLTQAVFDLVGSDDWAASRALVYGQPLALARGGIAALAKAVAQTQSADPASHALLQSAGTELARLALASIARFGAAPVVVAGRVLLDSDTVFAACEAALKGKIERGLQRSELHTAPAAASHLHRHGLMGLGTLSES